jgi:hypothetical protein
MNTEEDEAFDDLAKKQGSWGGGFQAKRRMAADKFIAAEEHKVGERYGYVPKLHPSEWMDAQPAQEPVNLLEARRIAAEYGTPDSQIDSGNLYFALMKCLKHIDAQPAQEPAFKWRSVFQEMPTENSHILFCFGVHIVEGSFTTNGWASFAYGTAQPDFWAYFPPPPHHKRNQELYTAPPKREWVGLTDEEMYLNCPNWLSQEQCKAWIQQIEAKLKKMNI